MEPPFNLSDYVFHHKEKSISVCNPVMLVFPGILDYLKTLPQCDPCYIAYIQPVSHEDRQAIFKQYIFPNYDINIPSQPASWSQKDLIDKSVHRGLYNNIMVMNVNRPCIYNATLTIELNLFDILKTKLFISIKEIFYPHHIFSEICQAQHKANAEAIALDHTGFQVDYAYRNVLYQVEQDYHAMYLIHIRLDGVLIGSMAVSPDVAFDDDARDLETFHETFVYTVKKFEKYGKQITAAAATI